MKHETRVAKSEKVLKTTQVKTRVENYFFIIFYAKQSVRFKRA